MSLDIRSSKSLLTWCRSRYSCTVLWFVDDILWQCGCLCGDVDV